MNTDGNSGVVILLAALGALGLFFLVRWIRDILAAPPGTKVPSPLEAGIGFVTNFFDTLGIGSFAPTTSLFKLWKVVPDEHIPGTMHVGHTPPVLIQAFVFIALIEVQLTTLTSMIVAAVLGAWLGAGVVARLPRRAIQIGMGVALLIAAVTFTATNLNWSPSGGASTGLTGTSLVIATGAMFVFGALMTLGIGIYAPTMITIGLLGMDVDPRVAFPIMMGASAFLMPVAAVRFMQRDRYDMKAAIGLTLGGIPAVVIAVTIVKALPLYWMRWLVAIVVLYAAIQMLRSAREEGPDVAHM